MFAVKLITTTQEQTNDMKDFATIINEAFAAALKEAINEQKKELASMVNTLVDEKIAALKNTAVQPETDEQFANRVENALGEIDLESLIDSDKLDFDVSQAVDDYLNNSTIELRIR
jgi:hypothetical protein